MSIAKPQTLTLDSSTLFLNSQKSLSTQTPPHTSLPPIPSNFPQSKLIPKTRFIVDGFRFAGEYSISYFLSHFHSDHYNGLTPNWFKGIIFCSKITAGLVVEILKIPSIFVVALPDSEPVSIDGCEVTLIDANHCPGAVQFLFKVPTIEGKFYKYVHTGDFRYCNSMNSIPFLNEFIGADAIFLDTTYCNPKFVFPSQEESIEYIVSVIERIGNENRALSKSILFLVATYVIGKEKILIEISSRCNRKVHVDSRKMEVLRVLGHGEDGVFTEDVSVSDVHVVGWNVLGETWPYFRPNFVKMKEIMTERGCDKVVGFVPTGWTYEVKRNKFAVRTKDEFEIHLVPYSEHSNYDELREYVKFLKPKRVIPTVGLDVEKLDSKHTNSMQKHFAGLVDEMAIKQEFLLGFNSGVRDTDEKEKADANDSRIVLNMPSSVQEHGLRDSVVLNEKESEEIMEELRVCLPVWVTREQMLHLISNWGRNIVDAVSDFYERETELYEQVNACTASGSTPQPSSFDFAKSSSPKVVNMEAKSLNTRPITSTSVSLGENKRNLDSKPKKEDSKSPKTKRPLNTSVSPGKKKRNPENKPNKKARITSNPEASGAKQSTITSFFSKVAPSGSQGGGVRNLLPCHSSKSFAEEIDKFIQIVNGTELSRSCAKQILEKAKGDLNTAVEIYYNDLNGELPISQCDNSNGFLGVEKKVLEESVKVADMRVQGVLMEKVSANLVMLPPEKYSPVDHGR